MFRIGAPDLEQYSASDGAGAGAVRSGGFGRSAGRLMVWAVLTVAVTLLLRPNAGRSSSMFFGSGPAAEMFNRIFGLSSGPGPEVVQQGAGITMVARGPAHNHTASHPIKKLDLGAAPLAAGEPSVSPVTTAPAHAAVARAAVAETAPEDVLPPKPRAGSTGTKAAPAAPVDQARAERPAGAKPQATGVRHSAPAVPAAVAAKLGPKYLDDVNGYSIHFPVGWRSKSRDGGRWVVDATDDAGDLISLGFRSSRTSLKVDAYNREQITRGLKSRPEFFVLGDGIGTLGGRPCLWHKYTGPVARQRMTVIHFRLPLENGRLMELRVATAPEKFRQLAPSLKQSVDTLRFVTPQARAQ